MVSLRLSLIFVTVLLAMPPISAQVEEATIANQLDELRSLSDTDRPVATIKIAQEISSLPAGQEKVEYADALSQLVTERDQGAAALQAVGDALSRALAETPLPATGGQIPSPYMDLAQLVRYKDVTTSLSDPRYKRAMQILAENDADVQKADFTLRDMHNNPVTLSALKGKIVLVNFWATWCPPCRSEMPALDAIASRFASQGLEVLSITDEEPSTVSAFLGQSTYHPTILLDPGSKIHNEFHIYGIPRTFIFNRDGKLIGQTIDECTWKQFMEMLSKTDLHP